MVYEFFYRVDKNDDSIQGQHEKAMGPEYGSLRREVLLNSGALVYCSFYEWTQFAVYEYFLLNSL